MSESAWQSAAQYWPWSRFEPVVEEIQKNVTTAPSLQAVMSVVGAFVIVMSLACWTNPSDASFRTFLTDVSLRQHLRQFDSGADTADPQASQDKGAGSASCDDELERQLNAASLSSNLSSSPPALTFAHRISLSLRTPPYSISDCRLFSIASVTPSMHLDFADTTGLPANFRKGPNGQSVRDEIRNPATQHVRASRCSQCGLHVSQSDIHEHVTWLVGMFGTWWVASSGCTPGRLLQAHAARVGKPEVPSPTQRKLLLSSPPPPPPVVMRPPSPPPEQVFGVFDMRTLDVALAKEDALPADDPPPYHREEPIPKDSPDPSSAPQNGHPLPTGSATPEDAEHGEPSNTHEGGTSKKKRHGKRHGKKAKPRASLPPNAASTQTDHDSMSPPAPATLLPDQNESLNAKVDPTVVDDPKVSLQNIAASSSDPAMQALAAAIETSDAANSDLSAQLATLQASTKDTRGSLSQQLEELRTRKRVDDAARAEMKSRMKALDESKRHADLSRRDAERSLKAAVTLQEETLAKIERAKSEVAQLRDMERKQVEEVKEDAQRRDLQKNEEGREKEVKEQEALQNREAVESLQHRLRELEEQLRAEKDHLDNLRIAALNNSSDSRHHASDLLPQVIGSQGQPEVYGHFGQPAHVASSTPAVSAPPGFALPSTSAHAPGHVASWVAPEVSHTHAIYPPDHTLGPSALPLHSLSIPTQTLSAQDLDGLRPLASPPLTSPFYSNLLPSNLFASIDESEMDLPSNRGEGAYGRQMEEEDAAEHFGEVFSDAHESPMMAHSRPGSDPSTRPAASSPQQALSIAADSLASHRISTDEASLSSSLSSLTAANSGDPKIAKAPRAWWGGRSRTASRAGEEGGGTAPAQADAGITEPPTSAKRRSFSVLPKLSLNPTAQVFKSSAPAQPQPETMLQPPGVTYQNRLLNLGRRAVGSSNATSAIPPLNTSSSSPWASSNLDRVQTDFDAVRRAFDAPIFNGPRAIQTEEEEGRRSWSAFDTWNGGRGNASGWQSQSPQQQPQRPAGEQGSGGFPTWSAQNGASAPFAGSTFEGRRDLGSVLDPIIGPAKARNMSGSARAPGAPAGAGTVYGHANGNGSGSPLAPHNHSASWLPEDLFLPPLARATSAGESSSSYHHATGSPASTNAPVHHSPLGSNPPMRGSRFAFWNREKEKRDGVADGQSMNAEEE